MLQNKQFLLDLRKHFRLNIYEVKIWLSLLSRGIASAGELADISGVPRSRCYDVLESLEKKGFIIMKIGKPIKYLALGPDIILDRVKNNVKEEADALSMQFDSAKESDEFKELELLHKTGVQHVDISSISKSIVGRSSINRYIKDKISQSKSNVVIVVTQEHVEKILKLLKGLAQNFPKKGVIAKIYSQNNNIFKNLQNVEHVEYSPSSSFVSIDGREIIFMISNDNVAPDYQIAIWIESPFFVNAVNVLFEGSLR